MAESRLIQKQLAGKEDLLLGVGTVSQARATGIKTITKLNATHFGGVLVVDTINDLNSLDKNQLDEQVVLVKEDGYTYIYNGTSWVAKIAVVVDTLADLKNISYPANTVWASGYHTKNDGAFGSHIFRLKGVKTTETDNGGTVIIATIGGVDYVYELQFEGIVNVKWFGAKGDGVTNDTPAINAAITSLVSTGGTIFIPKDTYKIYSSGQNGGTSSKNGIVIPYTDVSYSEPISINIIGEGTATKLEIAENDVIGIVMASSYSKVSDLEVNGSGFTNTVGVGLIPESMTQTTELVFQNYNLIDNMLIKGCTVGVNLMCGPDVVGADSGCWYNKINNSHIYYCTTGMIFSDGTNASSSGPNRNQINNVRIGQSTTNGIVIKAGGTNIFSNCSLEGISNRGIQISDTDIWGADNNSNTFIGIKCEAITNEDLYNNASYTEIYASDFADIGGTRKPMIMLGGTDASQVPQIQQGIIYQANNQISGIPSLKVAITAANGLSLIDPDATATDYGKELKTYAITTSNTNNVTSIAEYQSKIQSFGKIVDWHCRFKFQATYTGTVDIELPFAPNSDLYRLYGGNYPMPFPTTVSNGITTEVNYGQFSSPTETLNGNAYVKIKHSADFHSGGTYNQISFQLRYIRA